MLRPRIYPELLGKALVLEAQPFETLVEDDQPWMEGLMIVLTVGVLVGLAQLVGGLLTALSLPAPEALLTVLLNGWQAFAVRMGPAYDPAALEQALRTVWPSILWWSGYAGGWARLLGLVLTPLGLVIQWLAATLIVFMLARATGGRGTLNQTLGATALTVAPQVLFLLKVIPFVSVSGLLVAAWGLLILFRAVQVAHDLPWRQAAWIALAPYALAVFLLLAGLMLAVLVVRMGGVL
jgi:hypothetical protein